MKGKGINARAWFYSQSFHGNVDHHPKTVVTLQGPGGKDLTCKCCRVLYFERIGEGEYRAVCACGHVSWERRPQ